MVEMGSGLTPDLSHNFPADVLVLNWSERWKHAAFLKWLQQRRLRPETIKSMILSAWSWAGCIQHTQTIFICTFAMYMYIQSTMYQLAKLEIEAAPLHNTHTHTHNTHTTHTHTTHRHNTYTAAGLKLGRYMCIILGMLFVLSYFKSVLHVGVYSVGKEKRRGRGRLFESRTWQYGCVGVLSMQVDLQITLTDYTRKTQICVRSLAV